MRQFFVAAACLAASFLVSGPVRAADSSSPPPGSARSVAPSVAPAGEIERYVIPFFTSQTVYTTTRSTTIVTVFNNGSGACRASVAFQYQGQTTDICNLDAPIPARTSMTYCSRRVSDPITPCSQSCAGSGLTFNTGHALVSSSVSPSICSHIAVDAKTYYTSDVSDQVVSAVSNLAIVKSYNGNLGD